MGKNVSEDQLSHTATRQHNIRHKKATKQEAAPAKAKKWPAVHLWILYYSPHFHKIIQKVVIARILVSMGVGEVFQEHAYRGELHHKLLYATTFDWSIV